MRRATSWTFAALVMLLACGCGTKEPPIAPDVMAHRQRFLLNTEPADAQPVAAVRRAMQEPREVVVVGRIGGVDEPCNPHQSSFVIVDLEAATAAAGHQHKPGEDCPFCAKKRQELAQTTAIIRILGSDGQILPIGAQQLLEVSPNQTVVIRGQGTVNELGCLTVAAQGLYIRK